MSRMLETVAWFMDQRRYWPNSCGVGPQRERVLARTLTKRLKKVQRFCEQGRQALERLEEMAGELIARAEAWEPPPDGKDYEPAAEFIRTEMRQRHGPPDMEGTVRELGR
jgi:hypothetical protein